MAPGHIMEGAQSWSRLAIDHTIAVPGIGMGARIMSGGLATGRGGIVSACGFVDITSRVDTRFFPWWDAARAARYQAVASPPSKPRKVPTSVSERSWRFR